MTPSRRDIIKAQAAGIAALAATSAARPTPSRSRAASTTSRSSGRRRHVVSAGRAAGVMVGVKEGRLQRHRPR
jgi:anaerobic selenocysteine-containing dehydrogenase